MYITVKLKIGILLEFIFSSANEFSVQTGIYLSEGTLQTAIKPNYTLTI